MAGPEKIDCVQRVTQLFVDAAADKFWGIISFQFQAGKLVLVRKEMSLKVEGSQSGDRPQTLFGALQNNEKYVRPFQP